MYVSLTWGTLYLTHFHIKCGKSYSEIVMVSDRKMRYNAAVIRLQNQKEKEISMTGSGFLERYEVILQLVEECKFGKMSEDLGKMLEKELGYTQRYIDNAFSFVTGLSLTKYLQLRKLNAIFEYKKENGCSWDEAGAVFGYADNSFRRTFKNMYGCTPKDVLMGKKSVSLMPILSLEIVLKGEYEKEELQMNLSQSDWSSLGRIADEYSLYDLSFEQIKFAKEITEELKELNLDDVCLSLMKNFPDKRYVTLTEAEKDIFYVMLMTDCSQSVAEWILYLAAEKARRIDEDYLRLMAWILGISEGNSEGDKLNFKILKYSDFEVFKLIAESYGFTNYWDYAMILNWSEKELTWEDNIASYKASHPVPIEGNWDEDTVLEAWGYETDHICLAKVLSYIKEKGYDLSSMNQFDSIVFRLELHAGISKEEAEEAIRNNRADSYMEQMVDAEEFQLSFEIYKQREWMQ